MICNGQFDGLQIIELMKAHQIKVLTKVSIHWRIVIVRLRLFSIFPYINTLCKYFDLELRYV